MYNQNIIFLSDRYKVYENDMKNLKNRNVEYTWKNEKEMFIIGIPIKIWRKNNEWKKK